ncbi:rod shape-determining protein MreD [Ornithinimicrobium panacihumi]|uniref:rod shape-determining protein MreD n=1 Tax=Ornithinimicrobium panacihumi TaxID=2008449 RepID=UPI003F8ADC99
MNRIPGVLVRAILLVLAVLLPSAWPAGVARPDLVILVVAAAALMGGPRTGLLVGLVGGWLVDLVPPGAEPLGASALTYAAAGTVLGLARRYATASPLLPWVATSLAAALVLGVRAVTAAAGVGRVVAGELLWAWVITLVVAVLLLPGLIALERWLRERRWA